jgi:hypothetical protein
MNLINDRPLFDKFKSQTRGKQKSRPLSLPMAEGAVRVLTASGVLVETAKVLLASAALAKAAKVLAEAPPLLGQRYSW